jgi:acetoacetyl-CoA synthetase
MQENALLWQPDPDHARTTLMNQFIAAAQKLTGRSFENYEQLWQWSIDDREAFWRLIWNFCGVVGDAGSRTLTNGDRMPGARWFPDARLNFAENFLAPRKGAAEDALVFWCEDKIRRRVTWTQLRKDVAQLASALRAHGIQPGDRIAAYLPNMPESIVAMLAGVSIGAVFTSTSPDFGVRGVVDRFGQTSPRVLFAVEGYWYNGKWIDCRTKLQEIVAELPSLERVVMVPFGDQPPATSAIANAVTFDDFVAPYTHVDTVEYVRLPFDHPLYILYSSGTTGAPKCIAHGAGGTLLQLMKEHQLHSDIRPGDRYFYFTTCGWTMWNILVSGLSCGATLILYDGSPMLNGQRILFEYAQAERITHFGTSAKFIDSLQKTDFIPRTEYDLSDMRVVMSTGSPLVHEGFDYVYRNIGHNLQLASISGGTDICSCFVLGNPMLPVWRGEIQCKGLGMAVDVFDDQGRPVRGEKGELVCTKAFPSMPISFWNDTDGKKYHSAYFARFDNIWCHGDFCEITEHDGLIIYGRSDATLNPGGVRIGTAEIYSQVEKLPEILESIVVGQAWPPKEKTDVRVVLFVKLRDSLQLDDALRDRIKKVIRDNTTPRHVPAKIVQISDIPRTKSGKIVELAVRNVIQGEPVKNVEALANPEALDLFRGLAELAE